MSDLVRNVDVLIVGGGPIGLFMANECARRGLRYRIVEARPTQSEHSKALAIMPRTLEIFDIAGIVQPFLEVANRVTNVAVVSHGDRIARMHFTPELSPYPFVGMVPQDVTERLLVEALVGRGGKVEYQTSFISGIQRDGGVLATLECNGQRSDVSAAYVVGCDGAHSTVRHLLNLPFEGGEYETAFILADVATNETLRADEMQLCSHEDGPLAIFPMSSRRRRIVASAESEGPDAPSLDIIRTVLAQRGPRGIEVNSVNWSSYFRIHHRQVAQLRHGRFFIAGDAAHVHSPFGGQGMNTGLQDVWNLAWKLDLAVRGFASEELLDSYSAERRPVIKHVIETTDLLMKAMSTPSKVAQAIRDTVIPIVSRVTPFQHAFVQNLSELGVAYRGSPIVDGSGERYLDESMRNGGIGSRFLLLIGTHADSAIAAEAKYLADIFRDVLELRATARSGIVLVRPDGYAAYEPPHSSGLPALREVRASLERQTKVAIKTSA